MASHTASATFSRNSIHLTRLNIKVGMVRSRNCVGCSIATMTPSTVGSSTRKKQKSDQLNSLFSPVPHWSRVLVVPWPKKGGGSARKRTPTTTGAIAAADAFQRIRQSSAVIRTRRL